MKGESEESCCGPREGKRGTELTTYVAEVAEDLGCQEMGAKARENSCGSTKHSRPRGTTTTCFTFGKTCTSLPVAGLLPVAVNFRVPTSMLFITWVNIMRP
jgi:hypothetical protein